MTLAGTRPPTLDEWEKYELHHRARLAIKPGITGMWQVSGRSDITDFEEVVNDAFMKVIKFRKEKLGNRSRENKWKALCGNYVGGVLGVPHGLLSGGVLLIKMFDKL